MKNDGTSEEGSRKAECAIKEADYDSTKRGASQPEVEQPEAKRIKIEPTDETAIQPATIDHSGADKNPTSIATKACKVEPSTNLSALQGSGGEATTKNSEVTRSDVSSEALAGDLSASSNTKNQAAEKSEPNNSTAPMIPSATEEKQSANPIQQTQQEQQPLPVKAITMSHLQRKYSGELEYMLREFRKLERQLLGAKGATQLEESAGSRERREKLHSFILHLEDTIRQIELGCKLEAEGKTTVNVGVAGSDGGNPNAGSDKQNRTDNTGLSSLTQEKEEEENVQKLEEHILANLLPVKVRLKKQLAAQQGATRNPAGMPAPRRGYPQPSNPDNGKGTFAAAAEQRRKEAEEMAAQHSISPAEPVDPDKTHFGKPLGSRGSSLTQKLHGQTLGCRGRVHGHGVGLMKPTNEEEEDGKSKIIYGGVAPFSKQVVSGVTVAASAHSMVIQTPQLKSKVYANVEALDKPSAGATRQKIVHTSETASGSAKSPSQVKATANSEQDASNQLKESGSKKAGDTKRKLEDPTLTEEERETLRRKMKKKKLLLKAKRRELEHHRHAAFQSAQSQGPVKGAAGRKKMAGGKGNGKKRGPRTVEYICALCSEAYNSVSDYNPWYALTQQGCPKCGKTQIPRIDISAPANAIEYHPALLAHADDNGGSGANNGGGATQANAVEAVEIKPTHASTLVRYQDNSTHTALTQNKDGGESDLDSDMSDITDGNLSDISLGSDDSDAEVLATMTPAEKAEHEKFGYEYSGPRLSDSEASRLLILMLHANGCPCRHKSAKHRDVCRSTKYLMLHVRDCPGTTSAFDVCPFPWCRKVKHLLYHLVSCTEPKQCPICSPSDLTKEMHGLVGLNEYRLGRQRERMVAALKANNAGKQQRKAPPSSQSPLPSTKPAPTTSFKKPATHHTPANGSVPSKPKAASARPPVAKPRATTQQPPPTTEASKPTKLASTKTAILKQDGSGVGQPAGSVISSGDALGGPEPAEHRKVESKTTSLQPVAAGAGKSTVPLQSTTGSDVLADSTHNGAAASDKPSVAENAALASSGQENAEPSPAELQGVAVATSENSAAISGAKITAPTAMSIEKAPLVSEQAESKTSQSSTPVSTVNPCESSTKKDSDSDTMVTKANESPQPDDGKIEVNTATDTTGTATLELVESANSSSVKSIEGAVIHSKPADKSASDQPEDAKAARGHVAGEAPQIESVPTVRQTRSSTSAQKHSEVITEEVGKLSEGHQPQTAEDTVKENSATPATEKETCRSNSPGSADQPPCSEKSVAQVRVA